MTLRAFDLNLRHLRAVATIAERGSMNAAADAVSLSQPALTQGLAKLERQLGASLFERRPDGVTPTEHGLTVADRVHAAIGHLALSARGGRSGRGFSRPEQLMTATQLRAFLALADAGSFIGAAGATGLSQPAIHRAVRDLEQLLGFPLADRRGRGVALNPSGRRLARGVRLAASEIAAAIAEVQGHAEEGGRIVVGAMPLSRALMLPAAITALLRTAPLASIDVVEGSWRELVEPLRDGVIDVMIGALRDPAPAGLDQRPLFVDRLVVVARAGHPLAGTNPDLDTLALYPWIVGREGTPLRKYWSALFAAGEPPPAPIDCGSVMTIRGVLIDSDFLTLLSPDQVALELAGGVLTLIGQPFDGATRTIGVTIRTGWRPTRMQQRFIDLLANQTIPEIE
jgi:LysR family transcriptional regulator of gallate degradation